MCLCSSNEEINVRCLLLNENEETDAKAYIGLVTQHFTKGNISINIAVYHHNICQI